MNPVLTLSGTFIGVEPPGTYADKVSGEIITKKRQTAILQLTTGRTIDVEAATETVYPDSGQGCEMVVEIGARVVNFGKAAEPTFMLRSLVTTSSARRKAS